MICCELSIIMENGLGMLKRYYSFYKNNYIIRILFPYYYNASEFLENNILYNILNDELLYGFQIRTNNFKIL